MHAHAGDLPPPGSIVVNEVGTRQRTGKSGNNCKGNAKKAG